MRLFLLLTIILLSSCKSQKEKMTSRQQAIKSEMQAINEFYYNKMDSLDAAKKIDTNSTICIEIAKQLHSVDRKRTIKLFKLQKEFDYLQGALNKR